MTTRTNYEGAIISALASSASDRARAACKPFIRWMDDGQGGGWFEPYATGDTCRDCRKNMNEHGDCDCNRPAPTPPPEVSHYVVAHMYEPDREVQTLCSDCADYLGNIPDIHVYRTEDATPGAKCQRNCGN